MVSWIGAIVLAVAGLALGLVAMRDWLRYRACAGWARAEGKVAVTGLDSERRWCRFAKRSVYLPTVAFRYQAGGERHIGSRLSNRMVLFESEIEARAFLEGLPMGASVEVRYNPANPNEAVLNVSAPNLRPLVVSALLCLAGAALLVLCA